MQRLHDGVPVTAAQRGFDLPVHVVADFLSERFLSPFRHTEGFEELFVQFRHNGFFDPVHLYLEHNRFAGQLLVIEIVRERQVKLQRLARAGSFQTLFQARDEHALTDFDIHAFRFEVFRRLAFNHTLIIDVHPVALPGRALHLPEFASLPAQLFNHPVDVGALDVAHRFFNLQFLDRVETDFRHHLESGGIRQPAADFFPQRVDQRPADGFQVLLVHRLEKR